MNRKFAGALMAAGAVLAMGCRSEPPAARTRHAPMLQPAGLPDGESAVAVAGHPEVRAFQTLARVPHIEKQPCTRCHSVPQPRLKQTTPAAHWNIVLKHAKPETMNCATCHADSSSGELKLMQGQPVGFDHVYLLCAQCHSRQEKDWAGGAHGKRALGWSGSRVAMNCTSCHNPHQPAFAPRWPARAGRGMESIE